jgi:hypothetical protein
MTKTIREQPPRRGEFSDEQITMVIPRVTTREIIATDPDGHYARANGKGNTK